MASGMLAVVGLAVGFGVPVEAAGMDGVAARQPQAASRVKRISKKTSFVRTGMLRRRIQVFYLILKFQSAFRRSEMECEICCCEQYLFDGDLDGLGKGRFGLGKAQGQHAIGDLCFSFGSVQGDGQAQGSAE